MPNLARLPGRRALGIILLMVLGWLAPATRGQDSISEEQVKAAFLYNFARFTEWPASAFAESATPITLGVVGNDAFANTLATLLKEKKAHGRSFIVEKVGSVSQATGAHILFVAKEESRKATQFATTLRKQPVLLVGESEDFLQDGGTINLLREDKQLRFDINVATAEQNQLTISSHLLRLARKTIKEKGSR
jgi:hypothetical protein